MKKKKVCLHPEEAIIIQKAYRKNYPFGKRSMPFYYKPKKCRKKCVECGKILSKYY